jgi:hypothetical protein
MVAKKTTGTGSHFVPNPMFEEQLQRATFLIDDMGDMAEKALEGVRSTAPVDTGAYRDSWQSEAGIGPDGKATGRVYTEDKRANFIEFGTSEYPFGAPMRRGLERAGFKLEDSGGSA